MPAHGAPRFGRILVGNAGHDARMLVLDAFEISPPLGRRVNRKPHVLGRNDVAAEEREEARELAVAGGIGGGAPIAVLFLVTDVPAFSLALPNLFLGKFSGKMPPPGAL